MVGQKALIAARVLFAIFAANIVIGMLVVVLLIAYVPEISTVFQPDIY